MRLELYDANNKMMVVLRSSTYNTLYGEAINVKHTQEINKKDTLSFILPVLIDISIPKNGFEENFRWQYLKEEMFVKYIRDDKSCQWFEIKTMNNEHTNDGKLFSNVQCEAMPYNLSNILD